MNDHEHRKYSVVKDLSTGVILLVYSCNGTTGTLHLSAVCEDQAEALRLLALLAPETAGAVRP